MAKQPNDDKLKSWPKIIDGLDTKTKVIGLIVLVSDVIFGTAALALPEAHRLFALIIVAAVLVVGLFTLVLLEWVEKNKVPPNGPIPPSPPKLLAEWSRIVVREPKLEEELEDIQTNLRLVREKAVTELNRLRNRTSQIDSSLVRINVFLPGTEKVEKYGEVCGLYIPPRMQDNMDNFVDRNVRFRPHEGLTGRTFTLGEACGAAAMPDSANQLKWN